MPNTYAMKLINIYGYYSDGGKDNVWSDIIFYYVYPTERGTKLHAKRQ
jgi:hypothetical protein